MGSSLVAAEYVNSAADLNRIPDVLLPSQFFESVGTRTMSSEQRLMLAILVDAINILADHRVWQNREKRNHFHEASSWIFADRTAIVLSFDQVCDSLGLNAEWLRGRLSELVSEHGANFRRLRLKEGGRMQCVAVNRVHRRGPSRGR